MILWLGLKANSKTDNLSTTTMFYKSIQFREFYLLFTCAFENLVITVQNRKIS